MVNKKFTMARNRGFQDTVGEARARSTAGATMPPPTNIFS